MPAARPRREAQPIGQALDRPRRVCASSRSRTTCSRWSLSRPAAGDPASGSRTRAPDLCHAGRRAPRVRGAGCVAVGWPVIVDYACSVCAVGGALAEGRQGTEAVDFNARTARVRAWRASSMAASSGRALARGVASDLVTSELSRPDQSPAPPSCAPGLAGEFGAQAAARLRAACQQGRSRA